KSELDRIGFIETSFINSSSFQVGTFDHLTNVSIQFSISNSTKLNYLDEKIFAPFLDSHPNNRIMMTASYIDCNDCNSFWVFERKDLKERITASCDDDHKKNFWDDRNFKGCKRTTKT